MIPCSLLVIRFCFLVLFRLPVHDLLHVLRRLMILLHSPVPREFVPRFFSTVTTGKNDRSEDHHRHDYATPSIHFFMVILNRLWKKSSLHTSRLLSGFQPKSRKKKRRRPFLDGISSGTALLTFC